MKTIVVEEGTFLYESAVIAALPLLLEVARKVALPGGGSGARQDEADAAIRIATLEVTRGEKTGDSYVEIEGGRYFLLDGVLGFQASSDGGFPGTPPSWEDEDTSEVDFFSIDEAVAIEARTAQRLIEVDRSEARYEEGYKLPHGQQVYEPRADTLDDTNVDEG